MNRATSNYTLHVPAADDTVLDVLAAHLPPITDRQTRGLTFRATNDEAAVDYADRALSSVAPEVRESSYVTTGLAVHRRTVAEGWS